MKFKFLLIILLSSSSFLSSAWTSETKHKSTQTPSELVSEYFELKDLKLLDKHIPRDCRPQHGSCFRTACETVDRFECDDQDEMDILRRACRGSWGDGCIKQSLKFLDRLEYDDLEEMETLVNSCRGVYDTECINYTCQRMGAFDCDDLDEIVDVNLRCSGSRY
jgi:hypothetical protein